MQFPGAGSGEGLNAEEEVGNFERGVTLGQVDRNDGYASG